MRVMSDYSGQNNYMTAKGSSGRMRGSSATGKYRRRSANKVKSCLGDGIMEPTQLKKTAIYNREDRESSANGAYEVVSYINPHEIILQTIDAALINCAVDKLPQKQKSVIFLHFWCNMTWTEIGEVLGVSEQAVYKRWERALRNLRELMGN